MELSTLGTGAAVMALASGLIASCWSYLKELMNRLVALLIVRVTIQYTNDGSLVSLSAAEAYMWATFKALPSGVRTYRLLPQFVRSLGGRRPVAFEVAGKSIIFHQGWRYILFTLNGDGNSNPYATLSFFRGSFVADTLVAAMADSANALARDGATTSRYRVSHLTGNFGDSNSGPSGAPVGLRDSDSDEAMKARDLYRPVGFDRTDLGPRTSSKGFDTLWVPTEAKKAIEEVRAWHRSANWYAEHQVPWRRGLLLHGPPGTGKTSFARALAQDLDLPIAVLELSTHSSKDLRRSWSAVVSMAPVLVLIEDIDGVFQGRTNVQEANMNGNPVSFDTFLNTLSGVEDTDGVLVVITTNDIKSVDSALASLPEAGQVTSRPGRIDQVLEFGYLDEAGRRSLAEKVFHGMPEAAERIVREGVGDSGAQFQERLTAAILKMVPR